MLAAAVSSCAWNPPLGLCRKVVVGCYTTALHLAPSCPRLSAKVGHARLSPLNSSELGQARVLVASTSRKRCNIKEVDGRDKPWDKPGHDPLTISSSARANRHGGTSTGLL